MLPRTESVRLSKLLYKGFLKVYVRKFDSGSVTYLVQQNPNSGRWWSKFYNLYWEVKNFPVSNRKLKYTGWIAKKNNQWKEFTKDSLPLMATRKGWKFWRQYARKSF